MPLDAGADGVLVVDLPPEESDEMTDEWAGQDLSLIRLVAPTTPHDRMAVIAGAGGGFLYLVSKTGVTGSHGLDLADIAQKITALRKTTHCPSVWGLVFRPRTMWQALRPWRMVWWWEALLKN